MKVVESGLWKSMSLHTKNSLHKIAFSIIWSGEADVGMRLSSVEEEDRKLDYKGNEIVFEVIVLGGFAVAVGPEAYGLYWKFATMAQGLHGSAAQTVRQSRNAWCVQSALPL